MQDFSTLSTITPVYNGSEYLEQLVKALSDLRSKLDSDFPQIKLAESIFVLDEPIDNSASILKKLESENEWLHVVVLSKNFGQHPATICGILSSSSNWVVTLDEDMQHDPKYILTLLKTVVADSNDVCYANSIDSTHKSLVKDSLAKLFKRAMTKVLSNEKITKFNSYRIIRGDIARGAASVCRHGTYFDIVLGWFTSRVTFASLPLVDRRNIENTGKSGYTFMGLVRHASRMFLSSKVTVFRWGMPIGIFAFSLSVLLAIYALVSVFTETETILNRGWASSFLSVLFFGGLTVLLSSFILELVSEGLTILNGKPTFFQVDRSTDKELREVLDSHVPD